MAIFLIKSTTLLLCTVSVLIPVFSEHVRIKSANYEYHIPEWETLKDVDSLDKLTHINQPDFHLYFENCQKEMKKYDISVDAVPYLSLCYHRSDACQRANYHPKFDIEKTCAVLFQNKNCNHCTSSKPYFLEDSGPNFINKMYQYVYLAENCTLSYSVTLDVVIKSSSELPMFEPSTTVQCTCEADDGNPAY